MPELLIPYFQSHQNPQLDAPAFFITKDEARELKKARTHYFGTHCLSSHRGVQAIIEVPPQALPEVVKAEREAQEFSGWIVKDQTARPFARTANPSRPGNPHWVLAH